VVFLLDLDVSHLFPDVPPQLQASAVDRQLSR
jgi:hypothetical protein